MPFATRQLQNGANLLLQNTVVRGLEGVEPPQQTALQVYPKTWYTWTNRTGISAPDVSGVESTTGLTVSSAADAGTLVITADSSIAATTIGVAVVMWDEANNPIGMSCLTMTTSTWLKNPAGNFIACNAGTSYAPGFLAVDVSLAAGYTVLVQSLIPGSTVNLHWKLF